MQQAQKSFYQHLLTLGISLFVAVGLGWFLGQILLLLAIALAAWLAWYISISHRLSNWLISDSETKPAKFQSPKYLRTALNINQRRVTTQSTEQQEKFSALLDATDAFPEPLVFIDAAFNLLKFNPAAVNSLGFDQHNIGASVCDALKQAEFTHWLESRGLEADHLKVTSPVDNNLSFRVQLLKYSEDQYLLAFTDITKIQLQSQIRHDFVANVSHELRTPLTVLNGYLEVLKADLTDPNHEVFKNLYKQTVSMNDLVTDLLELARLQDESGSPKTITAMVDVSLLLNELSQTATELSLDQHKIDYSIDKTLIIPGKKRDLKSAFGNLIANAVRYTQAGGDIHISWVRQAGAAVFEVVDNGPGIDSSDIPRLTERFYRADAGRNRTQGGTGLGLAIVKHVVEKHNGRLEIESQAGTGSTFRIILPLAKI
ncbi:MAG: phosphate regulon sensor histidine kinase PhoR [Xanthomonadales bacterium]|nr:phosphate regulon sensor histidine kinase PhoR [Xanthomonadales bacterium]